MNKYLRKRLAKDAKTEEEKWLFAGIYPEWMIYIYEGLQIDFIKWYESEYLKKEKWEATVWYGAERPTHIEHLKALWLRRCKWLKEFGELIHKPFEKKYITACSVETCQQYERFKKDDLLNVIEFWGKAARHLYCAERDIFNSCPVLNAPKHEPLNIYYHLSQKYLMWHFASFVQGGSFTDFFTKIKRGLK